MLTILLNQSIEAYVMGSTEEKQRTITDNIIN